MLRYRCLLIDTEAYQERPIQGFVNIISAVQEWAELALAKASKSAYVVVYRVQEMEVARLVKNDQGTVQGLRPVEKEADQPL